MICFVVQELQELKQEKKQLQQKCEQQEQTLQEMGLHLSQSVPSGLLNIHLFHLVPKCFVQSF